MTNANIFFMFNFMLLVMLNERFFGLERELLLSFCRSYHAAATH